MGSSLDWCKERVREKEFTNLDVLDNANWSEIKLENSIVRHKKYLQALFEGDKFSIYLELEDGEKVKAGELIYDPEAEFDYFATERCRCDGTLLFAVEQQEKLIYKIISLQTVCAPKVPQIDSIEQMRNYYFKYTIGDFVFIDEYSELFATEEKPWMRGRFTTLLPIKFEVVDLTDY